MWMMPLHLQVNQNSEYDDDETKVCNFFLNCNLPPLDMYIGLSKVYIIKSEGRIHQYTKG